ncbi:MAG TPA: hypothetical protein VNU26_03735 [Mycobacteriales bacterium]|nr:hypothetical protein [Mycobacteriales bacterium]
MTRQRRRALALVAAGMLCLTGSVVSAVGVSAQEQPGSALGAFSLSATAPGINVRFEDGGNCGGGPTAGCEGVVPAAVSQLGNGPIGYGLASVAWPGAIAGNLGSVVVVGGGPQQATALNTPVRAEARTGQEPSKTSNTDYPGATMTASATATEVTALAETQTTTVPGAGAAGSISGSTRTTLTGASTAVATAQSRITDLELAAGVLAIESLTSTAEGSTDAQTATARGATTVSGATVAGVPVTIDERGITVQTQSAPVNAIATEAVNQAVSNAGLSVAVSSPIITQDGSSVVYSAGSLVVSWEPQEGNRATVVLGGASVSLAAAEGFAFELPPVPAADPPQAGTGTVSVDPGPAPADTGTAALDVPLPEAPPAAGVAEPEAAPTTLASQRLALPAGNGVLLVLLALLGAGLVAAGLKRLPDRVLAATAAVCPLGEER